MALLLVNTFIDVVILVITITVFATVYIRYAYSYWERKKVPYLKPKFPLGNNNTLLPKGISLGVITKKFYDEFKKMRAKFGGVYIGIQPNLVILDPEYIRTILTKDFQYFVDRGVFQNEKDDPIGANLFSQPGTEWRNLRAKFTSIFTSAKMKSMFETIVDCSTSMEEALDGYAAEKRDVDILEVLGCFTTDVIGSCAFGINCNSFKYPDAEFRKMGRKVFEEFNVWDQINLFLSIYTPRLARKVGVRNIQKDVSEFFFKSVKDTVEFREKNNVCRNDLLQLLIELKNSDVKLTMNELTAQAFIFFVAGFETSSTTSTLMLYELSRNLQVQEKIRKEVVEVLGRYGGRISYDAIGEMKYLAQAVDETLRIWPPVLTITRVCTKDYKLPNTDIVIEKDTGIIISVMGLQRDEQHWPDPLKWDPDRFGGKNKDSKSFTYLPFGEGPRNCIGMRFGLMQTKLALASILSKFEVVLSPKTITPLEMDPDTFLLHTTNKIYLNVRKI